MKRIICIALAALMLFAFAGCKSSNSSGRKKKSKDGPITNQVIHVGETKQYGDLSFKFKEIEVSTPYNWVIISLHLHCEYKGKNSVRLSENYFTVYGDGKLLKDDGAEFELWHSGDDVVSSGRSCDFTLDCVFRDNVKPPNTLELDYSYSAYSEEWGKITFVVDDLSQNESIVGRANSLIGTWELTGGEGDEAEQTVALMKGFGMTMTFTFNEDGKGSMDAVYGEEKETTEFTYTAKDGKLTLKEKDRSECSESDYRIEYGKLYMTVDGYILIFTKKK